MNFLKSPNYEVLKIRIFGMVEKFEHCKLEPTNQDLII